MITPDDITPALVAWLINPNGDDADFDLGAFIYEEFGDAEDSDDDGWSHVEFSAVRHGAVLDVEAEIGDTTRRFRVTVEAFPAGGTS